MLSPQASANVANANVANSNDGNSAFLGMSLVWCLLK